MVFSPTMILIFGRLHLMTLIGSVKSANSASLPSRSEEVKSMKLMPENMEVLLEEDSQWGAMKIC